VYDWESGVTLVEYGVEPPAVLRLAPGQVVGVELEVTVPQSSHHLVVDDPVPAGLELIDPSLETTAGRYRTWRRHRRNEDSRVFKHRELRDDRVVLAAHEAGPAVHRYRYLARATTSGTFLWPGTKAELMYEPEQFARSAEGMCTVE
jgi:uncharacterized protein YfaS (alpha-2-macroglobulin family)